MAEVERKYGVYRDHGVPAKILDAAALATAEPNLRQGLRGGLLIPDDSVIYPPCAAGYLLREAEGCGAKILLGRRITGIRDDEIRLDDGSSLSTHNTVVATGAAASQLIPGIAIQPRKGHVVITDRYPGFLRHQLIELGECGFGGF
jgi:L-2-hydroxyglutarate oxidase LhgO